MTSTRVRFRFTARARLAAMFLILFVSFGAAWEILSLALLHDQLPQSASVTASAGIARTEGTTTSQSPTRGSTGATVVTPTPGALVPPIAGSGSGVSAQGTGSLVSNAIKQYRSDALATFARVSFIALACAALLAAAIAWWGAGRVLQPLRDMVTTARRISAQNLDERLPVSGPADELRDLGETVNNTFDRLAEAFAHERRLVANTSHELRTPVANQRTLLEVTLADPDTTPERLREVCGIVLEQTLRSDSLIEAMLTLAGAQQSALEARLVELDDVVLRVIAETPTDGLRLRSELTSTGVVADPLLAERAVANLVTNAVRHNVPSGWIDIVVHHVGQEVRLAVTNSTVASAPADVDALRHAFRRGFADRTGSARGSGLGLSIVETICQRHGWELALRVPEPGQFRAEIIIPRHLA